MDRTESELPPERRAQLARKGQILYGKSCGPDGRGTFAESFARYQLSLGNIGIVRDLLQFLENRLVALRVDDPEGLLLMTESLTARIRRHLEEQA